MIQIKKELEDSFLVATISGMMDTSTSGQVEDELITDDIPQCKGVIIDMSGLTYISSSGIRACIRIHRHLKKNRIPLAFCSLIPFVYEIFEIADLVGNLAIYLDRESAITALCV